MYKPISKAMGEGKIFDPSRVGNHLTDFDETWNLQITPEDHPLCQIRFLYEYLIHDLLFLSISTIETRVSLCLITHCHVRTWLVHAWVDTSSHIRLDLSVK